MASYNGEKYIREQLNSILNQLGPEDEVIVSDDGSQDNTCEEIKAIYDKRVHLIYNNNNHGFTQNFENALNNASGDIVFLSDQDDIWASNKVKKVVEGLERYDCVISDCITVDNDLKTIQESRFDAFKIHRPSAIQHIIKSRYLGCCMAFKRNVIERALPFPDRKDLVEHDIWLASVALVYYKTCLIKEPLVYYRRHGENASDGGFEKGYPFINKIYRRIYRVVELIKIKNRK